MTMPRPAFMVNVTNPGSDLAGETAAALAAASIFYNMVGETAKADEALSHARELFDFANNYRGKYSDAMPVEDFYK
jgi:endoglucanase